MKPHLGVHGRREHHGTSGGQQRGGQQIVGAARHGTREQIRGGRSDHDEVCFLADPNVGAVTQSLATDTKPYKKVPQLSVERMPL